MKKRLFPFAFFFMTIYSFGQTVHKGSLLGLHTFMPDLKPGVSMKDYATFYTSTVIPEFEKVFPGVKIYLLKAVRGQDSSSMGVVYVFSSQAVRNKYFNNDGSMTKLGQAGNSKLSSLGKEMDKYRSPSDAADKYTDWVVQ